MIISKDVEQRCFLFWLSYSKSREGDITDSEDEEVNNVEVTVDIEDDEGVLEVIE